MSDIDPTAVAWLARFAEQIGLQPPDEATVVALLALAGEAAHRSHRQSAPVACWMASQAGLSPERALEVARQLD